ncbi:MAG TPA: MobA/MobL family protein [Candidatus Saccharimonadia bacterium]|nr:MobA/MobL family protein [Candidatus Saccharimonadia bacterium]
MAHLHFRRTVYKAGGGKAADRIEYITGRQLTEQSAFDRQQHYISKGREDLVAEGTRNLPAWAEGNPHTYFRAAEQYERGSANNVQRRGVAFEEWKITLPQELTHDQNQALIDDLLDTIAGDRLPWTYAFHAPPTLDGAHEQPHIHLLISGRMNDGHVRTAEQHFKRWNAKDPGRGGAQKDPRMNHQGAVYAHRQMISDILNVHLAAHGHADRVHPESLRSRGMARAPEPKLLPSDSAAYRTKGRISDTMAEVLRVREAREAQSPVEQANARAYWQHRARFLGLTEGMPAREQVSRIAAHAHGAPVASLTRSQPRHAGIAVRDADLDKRWTTPLIGNRGSQIYHLPTHKNYGDVRPENQVRFWTQREAIAAGYRVARNAVGLGASAPMETQVRRHAQSLPTRTLGSALPGPHVRARTVAAQLRAMTSRLGEETVQSGRGFRVRLHEKDKEQEQGMGW